MEFTNHAQILKYYRGKMGITMVQLGGITDTSPNTIGLYEKSLNKIFNPEKCERFTEALQIPKGLFSEVAEKMRIKQMVISSEGNTVNYNSNNLHEVALGSASNIADCEQSRWSENTLSDKGNGDRDDYILKRLARFAEEYIASLVKTKDLVAITELDEFISNQINGKIR